jgi:outer membrane murein-binding lipoprotein Lpp
MKTSKHCLLFATVLSAVWLAGCSTPAVRIRDNPQAFARLNPDQQASVKAGQVRIGMDMSAVELAMGKPDLITVRTNAEGQTQVWRYTEYAYYNNGFLHSGSYGGRREGGWGGRGYYGHGYWVDGYYGFGPSQRTTRLLLEFKSGVVSSIVEEKRR